MASLEIRLLGRPQIKLQGQSIEIKSSKAQGLLYYMAITRQRHSRQALAGLLWSDLGEESARRNLRGELKRVLDVIGPGYLIGEYESIELNATATLWTDVTELDRLLNQPNLTTQQLQEAIDLYRGPFLDDFHVRDAALFEEWLLTERERLLQAVQRASLRLVKLYIQQRQYEAAFACVNRLLAREPWLEEGHQLLMRLYALTGQRAEAIKQYETLSKALAAELGADVLPAQETEDLYDQIVNEEIRPDPDAGGQAAFLLTQAPLPPPFQAPPELLHFVGRDQELSQLRQALLSGGANPLCAIVGMGGMGKSALAGQLAHSLREAFPDGVLWAFVATSDPLDTLGNWARAFGYDFSTLSDVENRAAALRGVLADKRVLIILDDVRGTARTRPLLLGGTKCATLITTRDHDVAVALNARPFRLPELSAEEGIRLLARILGEERVAAEPEAAQAICRQLQNLPLAVEITAQRLVTRQRRKLADMAERLRRVEERLDLSISDRAVRTSFMVSWEALDNNLRHAFERLAVFAGRSFTAAVLAHIGEMDLYTAEDRLFELQRLSLVSEAEDERYRQHPLLADFAREQLGDNIAPLIDMAIYYQQFAEQHRTNYLALRPEWDNLMAGMETAHRLAQWTLVLAYGEALTQAWFTRARYTQARQGAAWAYTAAQTLQDEAQQALWLLKQGEACMEQNDYEEAVTWLTQSQLLYQHLEDAKGLADVNGHLARLMVYQGNYDEAQQYLAAGHHLHIQLDDQVGVATTLYHQAEIDFRKGDFAKAAELCQQAATIQEKFGDKLGLVLTLRLWSDSAGHLGQPEETLQHCQRALELSQELGNQGEFAANLYNMARILRRRSEFASAQKYAEDALALFVRMGVRSFEGVTLFELSVIQEHLNNYEQALTLRLQSIDIARQVKDLFNSVVLLFYLGKLYEKLNRTEDAYQVWYEAYEIAERLKHPFLEQLRSSLNKKG